VLLHQPVGERVHHGLDLVVAADGVVGGFIEFEVLRVQHNVHILHVAELAQFQRGELDLRRAAPAEDVDVRDR
jgi:hypothetical protein